MAETEMKSPYDFDRSTTGGRCREKRPKTPNHPALDKKTVEKGNVKNITRRMII
jgi:hypothetical protein